MLTTLLNPSHFKVKKISLLCKNVFEICLLLLSSSLSLHHLLLYLFIYTSIFLSIIHLSTYLLVDLLKVLLPSVPLGTIWCLLHGFRTNQITQTPKSGNNDTSPLFQRNLSYSLFVIFSPSLTSTSYIQYGFCKIQTDLIGRHVIQMGIRVVGKVHSASSLPWMDKFAS